MLASAAGPTEAAVRLAPTLGVGAGDLLRLLISLALVLGAIVLAARLYKRVGSSVGNGAPLRVAAVVSLGPKERVVLLDIGERQLLVGVAPGGISKLETFEQALPASAAPPAVDFRRTLSKVLGK